MGRDETKSSSKHKRSHDVSTDQEHRRKKRHKERDEASGSSKKRKEKKAGGSTRIVDEDVVDDDMWEEKNIDLDGEIVRTLPRVRPNGFTNVFPQPLATGIPTAESLKLTSRAVELPGDPPPPKSVATETTLQRDEWMLEPPAPTTIPDLGKRTGGDVEMRDVLDESLTDGYGEPSSSNRGMGGTVDFFTSLGTEHRKKQPQPDPTAQVCSLLNSSLPYCSSGPQPKVSHRELNVNLREGKSLDEYPTPAAKAVTPGGPGSQWRMMKLRRVYETAEEEGRPVEEVAIDRFGSLEAFAEAQEERRILDEREGRRASRGGAGSSSRGKEPEPRERLMFTDVGASGASSRSSSFRRPDLSGSAPSTPSPAGDGRAARRGFDSLRLPSQGGAGSALAQSHTPVPSVMTPTAAMPVKRTARALSPSELNKLQAKVLRAKLMNAPNAAELEKEYEEEVRRAQGAEEDGAETQVEVLPTLDARGRLYDTGQGKEDAPPAPGNRKKKEYVCPLLFVFVISY